MTRMERADLYERAAHVIKTHCYWHSMCEALFWITEPSTSQETDAMHRRQIGLSRMLLRDYVRITGLAPWEPDYRGAQAEGRTLYAPDLPNKTWDPESRKARVNILRAMAGELAAGR